MDSFPDETKIYNNLTNRIVPRLVGIESAPVGSPDRVTFGVGVAYSGAGAFTQTWRVNGRVGDSRVAAAGPVASILPIHTATDTSSVLNIELILNPSGRTLTATLTLQGQHVAPNFSACIMKSTKVQNPRRVAIQTNNARLLAMHRAAAILPRSVLAATQASSSMHRLGQG